MSARSTFGCYSLVFASQALGGCTVIGLGTGALVDVASAPKYETHAASSAPRIDQGKTVVLLTKDGKRTEGELLGASQPEPHDSDTYLLVEQSSAIRMVRQSELLDVKVEQPKRAWLYGGAIGLGLDVLTVALFAAFYDPSFSAYNSSGSSGGW